MVSLSRREQQSTAGVGLGALHARFEACVAARPDAIALLFREQALSYRTLNARANRLARMLRRAGVTRDTIIALQVQRSPEMLIGLLAILKAGGAFLPIDPTYPPARISYILEHSQAQVLLTQCSLAAPASTEALRCFDLFDATLYQDDDSDLDSWNEPDDLAYVLYTSGSTGLPKGVAITQQSVLNLIESLGQIIECKPGKSVLALTTVAFDIFVAETLLPLCWGMRVVIADEQEQADVELLRRRLLLSAVEVLQLTPSRLRLLLDTAEGLASVQAVRTLLVGGEAFPNYLLARLHDYPGTIYNLYGPTETTVYSLGKRLHQGERVNIGTPIANTQVFVVDAAGQCQPVGAEGELLIGGVGLARGYLHRPDLTAERFVPNPFSDEGDTAHLGDCGLRLYRTGDRVRQLPNGEIEFLGRLDRQVKLRGYRIELGEIEQLLLSRPQVKAAVVEIWGAAQQQQYLCAYVVPSAEAPLSTTVLRRYLAQQLPAYMIPAFFVELDELPLTPNGKIDRRALPLPLPAPGTNRVAPRNELEQQLAQIWADLLGFDPVTLSVDHSFFDLGGNSLNATLLLARIHQELQVRIPVARFFDHASIAGLAQEIAAAERAVHLPITPTPLQPEYPLSAEQLRVFIMQHLAPQNTLYNLPELYRVEGNLDLQRITASFQALVARHESFRSSFHIKEGVPIQQIHAHAPFELLLYETTELAAPELLRSFVAPFDLSCAPLLRVGVVRIEGRDAFFLLDMHHIIADGFSRDILLKEFLHLYAGEALPPLRVQYRDYLVWQQAMRDSPQLQQQAAFWLEMFATPVPTLKLPIDYPRPEPRHFGGRRLYFDIEPQVVMDLRALAREEQASLFILLFAVVSVFLARLTDQDDIVIGTPIAGRDHADLDQIIGMFVNTFALRTHPQGQQPFRAFLREVRSLCLAAFENQNYQFNELVDALNLKRDASRNPLFDVMFVLQDTETKAFQIPGVVLHPDEYEHTTSKVDLLIQMREIDDGLTCYFEYDTALFKPATMELLRDRLLVLLADLVEHPQRMIADLEYRTAAEKALYQFDSIEFDFSYDE